MPASLSDDAVTGMQGRFALRLLRAASGDAPNRNIALARFSVWSVLVTLWIGARGATDTALVEALERGLTLRHSSRGRAAYM